MAASNQAKKAYDAIRRALIARIIPSRSRVVEETWAQQLQVSRGAIRQALAQLFAEGLVYKGARGGFFSREYSSEEIAEINEVRLLLEKGAAGLALARGTQEDLNELDDIADHMILMAQQGYEMGLGEADVKFHEKLVSLAHNSRLSMIYERANMPITLNTRLTSEQLDGIHKETARRHKEMVSALRGKDLEKLENLLLQGMDDSGKSGD